MNSSRLLRTPLRPSLTSSRQWVCQSCQQRVIPRSRLIARTFQNGSRLRTPQQTPKQQNPIRSPNAEYEHMRAQFKQRNLTLINYTLSVLIGVLALSYASVPLYKTVCQTMGWGGQPVKSKSHFGEDIEDPSTRVIPVDGFHRIKINFSGSTSSILDWKFTPQQRQVSVLPGETALAFYTATNNSDEDIIGVATYSVSPDKVAPYFSKIQCFCFEEQRLNAGESVDMPVFFYIDPDFVKDPNLKKIETVTLHYTFFKAKYDREGHLRPVSMTG